jgi:NAD(P)-dependent dehydrogenase (short-subunit alcohol dehydrogenase family)
MKAILTGHSRGLGAAIADALLAAGIPVLALARHGNAELAARHPDLLTEIALDLGDPSALASWLASGALDQFLGDTSDVLLINNAGTLGPVAPAGRQQAEAIIHAVSLNVTGPLLLANALAARPGALRILHVSSGAARDAYPGWSIYGATKAALDHHARAVAQERRPDLRICSLAPGVVDTEMQAEVRQATPEQFPLVERFRALKRDGLLAAPAAVAAKLVAYLRSDDFGRQPVADLRTLDSSR